VQRIVVAAKEPRAGAGGSTLNVLQYEKLNHHCEVVFGLLENERADLLKGFFKARRSKNLIE